MTGDGLHWQRQRLSGFGMAVHSEAEHALARDREQVAQAFAEVAARRGSIALRGGGRSYGDPAMNGGGHVVELTAMRRVLAFDPVAAVITVEPGLTIRDLWRHVIPFGFWPGVVPGTMAVTIGGAAAMNIHGKNNYCAGPFGEWIERFELLTPAGDLLHCSREQNSDVFHAAIGGFGMLGCFVSITLRLKRVHSGRLAVRAIVARDLAHNLELIESMRGEADYLVSWLDLHARGSALGRGNLHRADQLEPGEDPDGVRFFDPCLQDVPLRLFGAVPKGWLWPGMWCAVHLGAVRAVNALKFVAGHREAARSPYRQSHGAFHFLLDYVPRWHWMTKPGGLIQFQPFVPAAAAERVLRELLESCHRSGFVSYLGVLKRHRPDPFLLTHAVDGFSLAMDFAVPTSARRRQELWQHCQRMADTVLTAGGRFYYAKDAVLTATSLERIHGAAALAQFRALKQRLDPGNLLQSDLSRRLGVGG